MAYSESQSDAVALGTEINKKEPQKKRVVVLGTGWAGTSFLKDLDISSYDVKVVSPRNYFAFTPLLPSVTCGTVEARSIVEPIRNIMKKVKGTCIFKTPDLVGDNFTRGIHDTWFSLITISFVYMYLFIRTPFVSLSLLF